jgi:hypothetical protein
MIFQLSLYSDIDRFHWHAADLTSSDAKKKERVRKKQRKRNIDAHNQGMHADPNGIRAAWFSDLHQICHSNNSENKHTHTLIFQLKMIYSYLDQHIGS